jgi:hypothetical protein
LGLDLIRTRSSLRARTLDHGYRLADHCPVPSTAILIAK